MPIAKVTADTNCIFLGSLLMLCNSIGKGGGFCHKRKEIL